MKRDLWIAEHRCTKCDSIMKKNIIVIEGMHVRSWQCSRCKEIILHPEDAQKMLVLNKIKKGMPVKVGALGESLIMRFPKEVTEFYKIKKGEKIILKLGDSKKLELEI